MTTKSVPGGGSGELAPHSPAVASTSWASSPLPPPGTHFLVAVLGLCFMSAAFADEKALACLPDNVVEDGLDVSLPISIEVPAQRCAKLD